MNKYCICGKQIPSWKEHCSHTCDHEHRYQIFIEDWLAGKQDGCTSKGYLVKHVRKYLFRKHLNSCSSCGWNKVNSVTKKVPLQVDHIDGNHRNCTSDNLRLLCPNCHSLTPTFGNLNKGNGRPQRYKDSL